MCCTYGRPPPYIFAMSKSRTWNLLRVHLTNNHLHLSILPGASSSKNERLFFEPNEYFCGLYRISPRGYLFGLPHGTQTGAQRLLWKLPHRCTDMVVSAAVSAGLVDMRKDNHVGKTWSVSLPFSFSTDESFSITGYSGREELQEVIAAGCRNRLGLLTYASLYKPSELNSLHEQCDGYPDCADIKRKALLGIIPQVLPDSFLRHTGFHIGCILNVASSRYLLMLIRKNGELVFRYAVEPADGGVIMASLAIDDQPINELDRVGQSTISDVFLCLKRFGVNPASVHISAGELPCYFVAELPYLGKSNRPYMERITRLYNKILRGFASKLPNDVLLIAKSACHFNFLIAGGNEAARKSRLAFASSEATRSLYLLPNHSFSAPLISAIDSGGSLTKPLARYLSVPHWAIRRGFRDYRYFREHDFMIYEMGDDIYDDGPLFDVFRLIATLGPDAHIRSLDMCNRVCRLNNLFRHLFATHGRHKSELLSLRFLAPVVCKGETAVQSLSDYSERNNIHLQEIQDWKHVVGVWIANVIREREGTTELTAQSVWYDSLISNSTPMQILRSVDYMHQLIQRYADVGAPDTDADFLNDLPLLIPHSLVDGSRWEARQLVSRKDLSTEGREMRHCVGSSSYAWQVASGSAIIVALHDPATGERYTAEFRAHRSARCEVAQLRGPNNSLPSGNNDVHAAVERIRYLLSERIAALPESVRVRFFKDVSSDARLQHLSLDQRVRIREGERANSVLAGLLPGNPRDPISVIIGLVASSKMLDS